MDEINMTSIVHHEFISYTMTGAFLPEWIQANLIFVANSLKTDMAVLRLESSSVGTTSSNTVSSADV